MKIIKQIFLLIIINRHSNKQDKNSKNNNEENLLILNENHSSKHMNNNKSRNKNNEHQNLKHQQLYDETNNKAKSSKSIEREKGKRSNRLKTTKDSSKQKFFRRALDDSEEVNENNQVNILNHRPGSKLRSELRKDLIPQKRKSIIRISENNFTPLGLSNISNSFTVKKFKNKNTKSNLELLNKIDNETVYAFSNEAFDDLAKKYYFKNFEEEKDSLKAIDGDYMIMIEPKIKDIEKTNYSSFFNDHIVIVGYQDNLYKLLQLLFTHHRRDICLITRYHYEDSKIIKLLKQYANLYYLKGQPDNPMNLINAGMNNAFMVIFLTEKLYQKTNEDMDNILIYKTVDYFFDTKILIEIWDNKNTKFIGYVPLIEDGKPEKNEFLHPCFMAGRCIYSAHLDSIIANSYLDKMGTNAWMKLLNLGGNHLKTSNSILKKRIPSIKKNNKSDQKNSESNNGSSVILTIDVPDQYIEKEYYILVDDLMKLEPPALALGIYVRQPLEYVSIKSQGIIKGNNDKNQKDGSNLDIITSHKKKLVNNIDMDRNDQGYLGKLKIMREISYNDKVVLDIMDINKNFLPIFITNPGPNFIISKNCEVMILYYLNGESNKFPRSHNSAGARESTFFNNRNNNNFNFHRNSAAEKGVRNSALLKIPKYTYRKESVFNHLHKVKKDNLKNKQEKILMFYEVLKKKIMNIINEKY